MSVIGTKIRKTGDSSPESPSPEGRGRSAAQARTRRRARAAALPDRLCPADLLPRARGEPRPQPSELKRGSSRPLAISPHCNEPALSPAAGPASPAGVYPHGSAVEAGVAAGEGVRGDAVRREARVHVPAVARREEQEVRRGAPHHREVPGALQAALLHPPRQVRAIDLRPCPPPRTLVPI